MPDEEQISSEHLNEPAPMADPDPETAEMVTLATSDLAQFL